MPEATREASIDAPVDRVWEFVADMDKWAPLMPGYVGHEKVDESVSRWTLKRNVGVITRSVTFEVRITEWRSPDPTARVAFELKGVNELVHGAGYFAASPAEASTIPRAVPTARRRRAGAWTMLRNLLQAVRRREPQLAGPAATVGTDASPDYDGPRSVMELGLEMHAGGPMGPMLDAMIGPLLHGDVQTLAEGITLAVETPAPAAAGAAVARE